MYTTQPELFQNNKRLPLPRKIRLHQ